MEPHAHSVPSDLTPLNDELPALLEIPFHVSEPTIAGVLRETLLPSPRPDGLPHVHRVPLGLIAADAEPPAAMALQGPADTSLGVDVETVDPSPN